MKSPSGAQKRAAAARQTMSLLLQAMHVTRIVYVDDIFDELSGPELAIGLFSQAAGLDLARTSALAPEVAFDAPAEVLRAKLAEWWAKVPPPERRQTVDQLLKIVGRPRQDYETARALRERFPREMQVDQLSPSQWLAQEETILAATSPASCLLCLFDQKLNEAGESDQARPLSGMALIKDVLVRGKPTTDNVVLALFTHTITEEAHELEVWDDLAKKHQVSLSQFLPISKSRLSGDRDPSSFIDGMRKAALNASGGFLKQQFNSIMETAHKRAANQLQQLDVYEFDHMVVGSSFEEGACEIDTLSRIYRVFERDEMRLQVLDPAIAGGLNAAVSRARAIGQATNLGEPRLDHEHMRKTRRRELYEDRATTLFTPLDAGDIFQDARAEKNFVLLAQPCDLAVRGNGKRRAGAMVSPLVPIERIDPNIGKWHPDRQSEYWRTRARMPCYYPDADGVAEFGKALWIRSWVLDLATMTPDGACKLDLGAPPPSCPQLPIGWQTHLSEVVQWFGAQKDRLKRTEAVLSGVSDLSATSDVLVSAMPAVCLSDTSIASQPCTNGGFDYGLCRRGRYRRPHSDGLLRDFGRFLSRDADDHDFSRQHK